MQPAENLDNKIKEFWPKDGPPIQEINKYIKKDTLYLELARR